MGAAEVSVRDFLENHSFPPRVLLGPSLMSAAGRSLIGELHPDAVVAELNGGGESIAESGPRILVLSEDDMFGPHREQLRQIVRLTLPGRPVVYGDARSREVLLDAINTWHVFRLVQNHLPVAVLADAVTKAHEAMLTELGIATCLDELRQECDRLTSALEELEATRSRLLHGERLATIGQMTEMLLQRVSYHMRSMDTFQAALQPLADNAEISEYAAHTMHATRSISTLLQDMLALAENRAEEVVLSRERLDETVERTVALFRLDGLAAQRSVTVELNSGATVCIDRYRMHHVLLNLLRNAAQATTEGGKICIRTQTIAGEAVVEVKDDGCGMSPEVLERVYTAFFTTKGNEGMGLGLRMSKSAIERQNGRLECESESGVGSTFRVCLPIFD